MSTLSFEPERRRAQDYVIGKDRRNVRAFLIPDRAREICLQYDGQYEIIISLEPGMDLERVINELMKHPKKLE